MQKIINRLFKQSYFLTTRKEIFSALDSQQEKREVFFRCWT